MRRNGSRRCTVCRRVKGPLSYEPGTPEEQPACRRCKTPSYTTSPDVTKDTKLCLCCDTEMKLMYFYVQARNPDGRDEICGDCRREAGRRRHAFERGGEVCNRLRGRWEFRDLQATFKAEQKEREERRAHEAAALADAYARMRRDREEAVV